MLCLNCHKMPLAFTSFNRGLCDDCLRRYLDVLDAHDWYFREHSLTDQERETVRLEMKQQGEL